MSFDAKSRYALLETATHTRADGQEIRYVRQRFLPRGETVPLHVEVRVDEGDRLDAIAARALGNAELYWQVCDASDAVRPTDLTDEADTLIRIPVPGSIQ